MFVFKLLFIALLVVSCSAGTNDVWHSYRCASSACGSQILVRECILHDCADWQLYKQCSPIQKCEITHLGFECLDDVVCKPPIIECTSGPCCKNGRFSEGNVICGKGKLQYCIGTDACHSTLMESESTQYCSGFSADCHGLVNYAAPIALPCDNGLCVEENKISAYCMPCPFGCVDAKCNDCGGGPCCDMRTNLFYIAGTECNSNVGYYCDPKGFGGIAIGIKSYQICDGMSASCQGPRYNTILAKFNCMPNQNCQAGSDFVGCY